MSLVGNLIGFGLRQVIGVVAGDEAGAMTAKIAGPVIELVEKRFTDHSQALPKALAKANDRAWQALSISLAGDGLLDKIKGFFASGDDKGIREQVRLYLQDKNIGYEGTSVEFRKKCLNELITAKKAGVLTYQNLSPNDVARQTANFQRYGDPKGMLDGAEQAVRQLADELPAECGNLAKLLRQRPAGGPPLLASAFAYFFRREVETNAELHRGLVFDGLRQLSASQEKAFDEVNKALNSLGDQFEQVFEQLTRIETVVVETQAVAVATQRVAVATHSVSLDIQAQLQRFGNLNLANGEEALRLLQEVLIRVSHAGMQKGEVKPHHGFSIRSEDEHQAVKQLLAQFRNLPADQQKQLPALLNGLGKLQHGIGDFDGARQSFVAVAENVSDKIAKAEAYYNAYRVALDKKNWNEALESIQQAAKLAPERYALFPQRYQPRRILGAGGFGAAFLCYDPNLAEEVVVKAIHATDTERSMDSVFQEARTLRKLGHEAIIRVIDCAYADPTNHARPYLIMDFFPGGSLENFVRERGTLTPEHLVLVAREIAAGMRAAHQQNILHRDLKPDNVLVNKQGDIWKVKIIDFGLAMQRQTIENSTAKAAAGDTPLINSAVGTVKYAPPEQMDPSSKVPVGRYSDVYAFGKMCSYALFRTTRPTTRHWKNVPENLRSGLQEMFEKCWEEEIEHRYADFEPVLKVLEALGSSNRNVTAPAETPLQNQRRETENKVQQDGERVVAQFLREVYSRTGGTTGSEDEAVFAALWKQHHISPNRVNEIIEQVKQEVCKWYWFSEQGKKHFQKDEYDKAIAAYTEVIRLLPTDKATEKATALECRSKAYGEKGDFDRAVSDWQEAVRLDPDKIAGCKKAIADCTESIRDFPTNPKALLFRAIAYRVMGNEESAAADLEKHQQQELARLEQEGETRLTQFLQEVFSRTQGKPTKEDTAAANDLCKRHRIPSERAKQIVREFREKWQKAHPHAPNSFATRAEPQKQEKVETPTLAKAEKAEPQMLPTSTTRQGPLGQKITNSIGMEFVWIPPGTFLMGSPPNEEGRQDDESQHKVTLTKGFYMGVYPVTQGQWAALVRKNPSRWTDDENRPVDGVSRPDCQHFIRKLREQEKKDYRLPTEAEWEYACRAGTTTPYSFGETIFTDLANFGEEWNSGSSTMPVGQFPANTWGLFDMHGNVWEWCQDWYGNYPRQETINPQGPKNGEEGVLRGGDWTAPSSNCRVGCRCSAKPDNRGDWSHYCFGFRLCFFVDDRHLPDKQQAAGDDQKTGLVQAKAKARQGSATSSSLTGSTLPENLTPKMRVLLQTVEKKRENNGTYLNLDGKDLDDEAIAVFASSPHLASLSELYLVNNKVGPRGVAALANSLHLAKMKKLSLRANKFGDAGVAALTSSTCLVNLEDLDLDQNDIGDSGATALANWSGLANLTKLWLGWNEIGGSGTTALANSLYLHNLRILSLEQNKIGDRGLVALANSPHLANLKELRLRGAEIGDAGAAALANSPHLAKIKRVDLDGNSIGDAGALALANSLYLADIQNLELENNEIGDAGMEALLNRFGDKVKLM